MKLFHALTYTNPNARVSWKVLLYAALCTLFGTACLYCFTDQFHRFCFADRAVFHPGTA